MGTTESGPGAVLVAYDHSAGSRRALARAVALAQALGCGLLIVHVIEWSPYRFTIPEDNAERHRQRQAEIAAAENEVLAPACRVAGEAGVAAEALVRHGHVAESLSELAAARAAALIVCGRRGQSRIQSLLLGSVATSLVQISQVPVLVVP